MNNDTNSKVAIFTAKTIMDLANFIAMFLASILSFERLKYWQAHKNEMKTKLRRALAEVFVDIGDEFSYIRRDWEAYYLKAFGWTVDFSEVKVIPKPADDYRLEFVAKSLTCDKVYESWTFPKWKYMNGSIDAQVVKNMRMPTEHYAVWVRVGVEPDAEFIGKSTNQVDPDMKIGMSLLERMLLEGKYFDETGKHLDIIGGTYCSASRDVGGNVPYVSLNRDGEVCVYWFGVDYVAADYGVRRAVST
jgi:hypothetical protein